MGGGRQKFPKDLWTPYGGPYANPRNWKTLTIFALLVEGIVVYCAAKYSGENMVFFF